MKARLLLSLLALALSLACSSKSDTESSQPPQPAAIASGQSSNWRVELVSVKENADYSDPSGKRGIIYLHLRIEYLGPTADMTAPQFAVVGSDGASRGISYPSGFRREGQSDPEKMKMLGWLVANSPFSTVPKSSLRLEQGTKFDGVLDFKHSGEMKTFKLVFVDVPEIPFDVRRER